MRVSTQPAKALTAALLIVLAGIAATMRAPAAAEIAPMASRYDVAIIGLPVARASFETRIDGNRFSVSGTLGSMGLADIFTSINGKSHAEGRIAAGKMVAERYGLDYTSGKKSFSSAVALDKGRVTSAEVVPKSPEPAPNYIPVTANQLQSVVDPLSGLMISGKADASLCERTLPFFDGWSRLDLQLSAAGTRSFSTDGYEGDVIVCKVRVAPISGYKATSRGVKYIQKQTIELWFAPVHNTGLFAPVYARIPTEIGPLTLRASVFAKN